MQQTQNQNQNQPIDAIEGGYILIQVEDIQNAWKVCNKKKGPGAGGFRAWIAVHEIITKRKHVKKNVIPNYKITEIATLMGVTKKSAKAAIKKITNAGLLSWTNNQVQLQNTDKKEQTKSPFDDTIGRGQGNIAVPRRILRFLANKASLAIIATAIAALMRCISRRRTGWASYGRFKASWVANAFGISIGQIKKARTKLAAIGWITPEKTPGWSEVQWGRAWKINLQWASQNGSKSTPAPAKNGSQSTPPDQTRIPIGKQKDQKPRQGDTGDRFAEHDSKQEQPRTIAPQTAHTVPSPLAPTAPPVPSAPPAPSSPSVVVPAELPSPRLNDIRVEDLSETARTLELHGQAIRQGLITPSEHDRFRFLALAEHARSVGKANPPGLFAALLRSKAWSFITASEEDAARRRLHSHHRASSVVVEPRQADLAGVRSLVGSLRNHSNQSGQPAAGAASSSTAVTKPARRSNFVPDGSENLEARRAMLLRQLATRVP